MVFDRPIGHRRSAFTRLSFSRQFLLLTAVMLLVGLVVLGFWVQAEIEQAVIDRTAAVTALYVDSFVAPHLQELDENGRLPAAASAQLDRLLNATPLGTEVVSFKVWAPDGTILYAQSPELIGRQFPAHDELVDAMAGEVVSSVSDLSTAENAYEQARWDALIETYAPVREAGSGRVVAVSEFYQLPDGLQSELGSARLRTWAVVITATALLYLLLVGLVRRASNVINSQRDEAEERVAQLRATVDENEKLQRRMRRAAARTTALNERFLHRISADIHDGPAQDVSLALLRLDSLSTELLTAPQANSDATDLATVHQALDSALSELRTIARGLRLPELEHLSLTEAASRIVDDFERMTGRTVNCEMEDPPDGTVPLPVRLALCRVLQEALGNSYRHSGGANQSVWISSDGDRVCLDVVDDGTGFDLAGAARSDALGVAGMRERVRILGGDFEVTSGDGGGTRVRACLPLTIPETDDE